MLEVNALDHIVINVTDVEKSAAWYAQALGMRRRDQKTAAGDVRTSMEFGKNKINLRPVQESTEAWFTAQHPSAGSDDLCFLTQSEPAMVAEHFRTLGIEIEEGPVTKSGARGPIESVYVRDPDGNLIEVSSYRTHTHTLAKKS